MTKRLKIKIMQLPHGKGVPLPKYMSHAASGMDLYAAVEADVTLKPGERKLIPTGFKMALPKGYEAQVRPRSGLAIKNGISVLNTPGTIDEDYRGEVGVILINHSNEDFIVKRCDRIAQMVINKVDQADIEIVDSLDETHRSSGGFGHTGV
jgi:dUTP pyrophosphatase